MSTLFEQVIADNAELVHRLTAEQLRRMESAGILSEGEPLELIDGLLVLKDRRDAGEGPLNHGIRHATAVRRLAVLEALVQPHGFHLQRQLPIALSDYSEPDPDGAIVRGSGEDYSTGHLGPTDLLLVIEVADSSLNYDRTTKQRIYASAGIPHYWIVNLRDNQVEQFEHPAPNGAYSRRTILRGDEQLSLLVGGSSVSPPAFAFLSA